MATGAELRTTTMAEVQRRSPAQTRPLSLQVDSPPSASPFPSPSSSFLPPPMPGAHEFAVKPPPRRRSAVSTTLSADDGAAAASNAVREPVSEPTVSHHPIKDHDALSPTMTPMQQQYRLSRISTTTLEEPSLDTSSEPNTSRRQSNSISSPTILNSPSLASSRPAPLSPAPSRRVSTISTRSSKSGTISTPMSRSNSRRESRGGAGFPKRLSALSMSGTATMARKGDRDDTVFNDGPLITPTVSASSMNLQSTASSSSSPSSTTTTTTANTIPISLPSSSTPTTTTPTSTQNPNPASSSSPHPPHPTTTTTPTTRRPTSIKIKIRDFAYTSTDNRYRGIGSDVPKPNQFSRLNKKLGGPKKVRPTSERWSLCGEGDSSTKRRSGSDNDEGKKSKKSGRGRAVRKKRSSNNNGWDESDDNDDNDDDDDDTSDEEEEEDNEEEGWFKKGMGRFSWSFGFPGFKKQVQDSQSSTSHHASYPSRGEMDLNFSTAVEDETPSSESSEYYDAPEDEVSNKDRQFEESSPEGEDGMVEEEEEEPLYPGLYRALYPFEPEGTAEMRLVEDQIVRVVGRGGGVGWAVVVVPEGVDGGVVVVTPVEDEEGGEEKAIRHALVPESYLELVRLD